MEYPLPPVPEGMTTEEFIALLDKAAMCSPKDLTEAELDILRSIVPDQVNPCGDCRFCCIAPGIDEENVDGVVLKRPKPACTKCEWARGPSGCAVYARRPAVCRDYLCAYSIGQVEDRPDRVGVAWSYQTNRETGDPLLIGHATDTQAVLSDKRNRKVIRAALHSGAFAAVTVRDDRTLVGFVANGPARTAQVDKGDWLKSKVDESTEREVNIREEYPWLLSAGVSGFGRKRARRAIEA